MAHDTAVANYTLAVTGVTEANAMKENDTDFFTISSLAAFNEAVENYLDLDDTATTDQLNAATDAIIEAAKNLVTLESVIDARLRAAVAALSLYEEDNEGKVIYYKETIDGNIEICDKDDEGAFPNPDKGVERIDYADVNGVKTATFVLAADQLNVLLTEFMNTGVLTVFDNDFNDLTKVVFKFEYNGEYYDNFEYPVDNGMYLAAGLLAVCSGMQREIVDFLNGEDVDINEVLRQMKAKTFNEIKGTECEAEITVSNDEYTYTANFKVIFTDPTNN